MACCQSIIEAPSKGLWRSAMNEATINSIMSEPLYGSALIFSLLPVALAWILRVLPRSDESASTNDKINGLTVKYLGSRRSPFQSRINAVLEPYNKFKKPKEAFHSRI